ncbi:mitochondrial metalloendopeptidase OMA1 [Striga asiatica]|uniref:Mitochondrial metalloendopeptidase OMA1 n=1 Tax=Striga asiatica TaxID=4170 RepID=A0A5A7QCU0_STRAF|nr:mitochondrial metalloendopeptidase OMA1 [Striga asiatica]
MTFAPSAGNAVGDHVGGGGLHEEVEHFFMKNGRGKQSRIKGHEKGTKSRTAHLEGLKWEVIVVDEPMVNAFCLPGGKIVVFVGLLKHFRADAELATVRCITHTHIDDL